MTDDDLDPRVRQALRDIPEDPDAPARLVTALSARRSPPSIWRIAVAAAIAASIGFGTARAQGPLVISDVLNDPALALLGGTF